MNTINAVIAICTGCYGETRGNCLYVGIVSGGFLEMMPEINLEAYAEWEGIEFSKVQHLEWIKGRRGCLGTGEHLCMSELHSVGGGVAGDKVTRNTGAR